VGKKFALIFFINIMNLTNLIKLSNNMNYTLNLFNTGQITLPKKWREQFETKKFIAKETPE
jgi:hypothetical protein